MLSIYSLTLKGHNLVPISSWDGRFLRPGMDWLELLGNVLFLGQNHSFKGFPIPFHEEPDILLDLV